MSQYIPVDQILHKLSQESGARPSIDLSARIPGTSRVERTKAKSPKVQKALKGLSRAAVKKSRITAREYHIRTKSSGMYIGLVKKENDSKKPYGYRLKNGAKGVYGYTTQEEAIRAMLRNV